MRPCIGHPQRFRKHCELHPEWADEARRLAKANEQAAAQVRVYGDYSLNSPVGDEDGVTWLDTKTDADRLWA